MRKTDRLIIDAGANIGAFVLYALLTAPNARVIAIEPAPDSYTASAVSPVMIDRHGISSKWLSVGLRIGKSWLCFSKGREMTDMVTELPIKSQSQRVA